MKVSLLQARELIPLRQAPAACEQGVDGRISLARLRAAAPCGDHYALPRRLPDELASAALTCMRERHAKVGQSCGPCPAGEFVDTAWSTVAGASAQRLHAALEAVMQLRSGRPSVHSVGMHLAAAFDASVDGWHLGHRRDPVTNTTLDTAWRKEGLAQ